MANYTSNLKTWGDTGAEYPTGYSYLEGEQPVDAWDNNVNYNAIEDILHLVNLTNARLESSLGTADPASPEDGEMVYRTDLSKLKLYDSSDAAWHTVLFADNAVMEAALDMGGYKVTDSSGTLTLGNNSVVEGNLTVGGARLDQKWFSKQEGGTVTSGNSVVLLTVELADTKTLEVTQAHLSEDGWSTPAKSGIDLIISAQGVAGAQATIFSGDGTTFHESTGSPLASYQNTSGAAQQVAVLIDNGEYGTGTGADDKAYGGVIAHVN